VPAVRKAGRPAQVIVVDVPETTVGSHPGHNVRNLTVCDGGSHQVDYDSVFYKADILLLSQAVRGPQAK
jgi:hypothetical protein